MSDAPPNFRGEVTRSILRTLDKEAVRNELTLATARMISMAGLTVIEVWLLTDGSKLGAAAYPLAGVSLLMAAWSVAIWHSLKRGRWHASLPYVIPTIDALYFIVRQGLVLVVLGANHFIDVQDLATVLGMSALLITSGAFRLSSRAVGYAMGLGVLVYVGFAMATHVQIFFASVHLLLLMSVGVTAFGLTRIVDRAVHSEVTRMTIGRLLPAPVLEAASSDPVALLSEPRSLQVTILVSDLRGFTSWSEDRAPLDVLARLNQVQGALAQVVHDHGGTVDKFMGDGMLAVFGAPTELPDHASEAVRASAAMLKALDELELPVKVGIGIHSGEVVVGCLGSGIRMEFTVLGDTVNTASRLEAKTKETGHPVLLSATTASLSTESTEHVGAVELRGKNEPIQVYTLP